MGFRSLAGAACPAPRSERRTDHTLAMLEAEVLCHEQARLPRCDGSRPTHRRDVTILDAVRPRLESDVGTPYRIHGFGRRPLRVRAYRKGEAINYLALLAQPDLHRALVRRARRNHELERVLAGRERLEDGRSVPPRGRSRAHRRAVAGELCGESGSEGKPRRESTLPLPQSRLQVRVPSRRSVLGTKVVKVGQA